MLPAALLAVILAGALPANAIGDRKLVDLTYEFSAETQHWPTAKPFNFDKVTEGKTAAGFWYSSYNYRGSEPVGAHLDAVIDVSRQADIDADDSWRFSDRPAWENVHGQIPSGAILP